MKKHVEEYIKEFDKQDLEMEFRCVNALQKTPWRINKFVA